ncbi:hypothetical protein DL93DRAFT_2185547 [Clavulina sp. PMI_390]|nr:hypothetical protein DL93DRAFT_2185547 [Clavulina sp. PMI_390]
MSETVNDQTAILEPTSDKPSNGISNPLEPFINHIMTPGSTYVSPTFLLLVDITLSFLLFLFISLFVMTWSLHFVALGIITCGLWGSVKLYVFELRKEDAARVQAQETEVSSSTEPTADSAPYTPKNKDD